MFGFLVGLVFGGLAVLAYDKYVAVKKAVAVFSKVEESKVLALALDIFDKKAPEVFAQLSGLESPVEVLGSEISSAIEEAQKLVNDLPLESEQREELVQLFGELYNPLVGAAKMAKLF